MWNALAGRVAILAAAALTLGGLAIHAETIRPAPFHLDIPMACYTQDGTPADCGL